MALNCVVNENHQQFRYPNGEVVRFRLKVSIWWQYRVIYFSYRVSQWRNGDEAYAKHVFLSIFRNNTLSNRPKISRSILIVVHLPSLFFPLYLMNHYQNSIFYYFSPFESSFIECKLFYEFLFLFYPFFLKNAYIIIIDIVIQETYAPKQIYQGTFDVKGSRSNISLLKYVFLISSTEK